MENEFQNTMLQGFSHRAQSEEFRELIKDKQKKNTKKNLIVTLVFLGLLILTFIPIIIFDNGAETEAMAWITVLCIAAIPIFGITTLVMAIATIAAHISNLKKLQKDSWDGIVLEKKYWVTTTTDEDGTTHEHDNYRIIIEKPDGKKFKMRGNEAKAFLPYVEHGDRVRCHPGFRFPLELFDKSKHYSNICVFCGERNDARNNTCTKCGKPMLI